MCGACKWHDKCSGWCHWDKVWKSTMTFSCLEVIVDLNWGNFSESMTWQSEYNDLKREGKERNGRRVNRTLLCFSVQNDRKWSHSWRVMWYQGNVFFFKLTSLGHNLHTIKCSHFKCTLRVLTNVHTLVTTTTISI
jgi:hypothetical protein